MIRKPKAFLDGSFLFDGGFSISVHGRSEDREVTGICIRRDTSGSDFTPLHNGGPGLVSLKGPASAPFVPHMMS